MRTEVVIAICVAVCGACEGAPALQALEFREAAVVVGERVTLGDLATILPPEAAALAATDIGPAPGVGQSRSITVGLVKQRLRFAKLELRGVKFAGCDRVLVSRAAATAPAAAAGAATTPGAAALPPKGPAVRAGAPVTLRVRYGDLMVETPGETLASCCVGDVGKFRVVQTRTIVWARLVEPSRAEVTR